METDWWKIKVRTGAISTASSLRSRHGKLSGPPALDALMSLSSLVTPFMLMYNSFIGGILGPSNTVSPFSSSSVNTDEN